MNNYANQQNNGTSNKLFEDVDKYQSQIDNLMSTDAEPADIAEALKFTKGNLKEQVVAAWKVRENYSYRAECVEAEISVLQAKLSELKNRAAKFNDRVSTIDDAMMFAMMTLGEERIFTPLCTVELVKSAATIVYDDEASVPDELRNPTKKGTPSAKLVKEYLAANPQTDWAHFETDLKLKFK